MMGEKHLHELLREDQEPFQLHKPSHLTPIIKLSLCRKACFFSFHHSPDHPFLSPAKSPSASANFFLHIPPKTSALLLEAALKVHKQSSKPNLFGSFFKKLVLWNNTKTHVKGSLANGLSADKWGEDSFIYNSCRLSSSGWPGSIEDKSLDMMETSSSTTISDYYNQEVEIFCSTPSTPFRLPLDTTSSRTPDIISPVASPICHKQKDNNQLEEEDLQKIKVEEKDQCSPVSVLDPPFDDDEPASGEEEGDDFDVECSYAILQRAKLQLLHKLRRFERLAELDPVDLEKLMFEDEDDDSNIVEEEECDYVDERGSMYTEENLDEIVREVLRTSNECHLNKIPADVKRLLSDLIAEEQTSRFDSSSEPMIHRVCKRLKAWKEVEPNTIDMMVELDFRKVEEWNQYQEEVGGRAREIELAIFGLLVEELGN